MVALIKNRFPDPDLRNGRVSRIVFVAWALLLIPATTVFAHRVVVFAWIEGDMVYTQSKFPGGARVHDGKISVVDDKGKSLLTGTTDDQGEFSFDLKAIRAASDLKIVLNAGMGHQASWTLTEKEICRALGGNEKPVPEDSPALSPEPSGTLADDIPCPMDEDELRKIVETAVDRKLSPVMDMLITMREEAAVGLDDVVAGLGYILGLTGLLAWFASRKKG